MGLVFVSSLNAQIAFYDAQFLNSISREMINEILAYDSIVNRIDTMDLPNRGLYTIGLSSDEDTALNNLLPFLDSPFVYNIDMELIYDIFWRYEEMKNQLIEKIEFDDIKVTSLGAGGIATTSSLSFLSKIPSIVEGSGSFSGKQESNFYDGITKVVMEQFKEGVTLKYLEIMEERIGNIGEVRYLFPETYELLLDRDPFQFPELGDEYKETFNNDLKKILTNLQNLFDNYEDIDRSNFIFIDSTAVASIRSRDEYQALRTTIDIVSKLINNYHPADLMNYLAQNYRDTSDFSQAMRALNIVQSNLRDTTKIINGQFSNVWIDFEQLKDLDEANELKYFFALLYHQDTDLMRPIWEEVRDRTDSDDDIDSMNIFFNERITPIFGILRMLQEFPREASNYKKDYDKLLAQVFDILYEVDEHFITDDVVFDGETKRLIKNSINIITSIKEENYYNIINNLITIIEIIEPQWLQNPDFVRIAYALNTFGDFMVATINAENSDEMKEVIKKYIAEPQSYIIKRNSLVSFSISAHPGYYFSLENGSDEFKFRDNNVKLNTGLTLPIGFELAWALKGGTNTLNNGRFVQRNAIESFNGYSLSLFAQLVDLGAILNFRLQDGEADLPEEVNFSQIFSPGLTFNVGLKNTPLTIGAGYQYAPKLRKFGQQPEFKNTHRLLVRATWDIPLLNIASKKPINLN